MATVIHADKDMTSVAHVDITANPTGASQRTDSSDIMERGEIEKPLSVRNQLDERLETEAYSLEKSTVVEKADGSGDFKLALDGHTLLIPQPSDDPNDPLNWSWWRKHAILFIVSACAFLPNYGIATGAVTLIAQSKVYGITPDEVNHSQSGGVFMVGAGGLFVVVLSAYIGRFPILFWFLLVAFATAVGQAGSQSFNSFFAARVLNGFFSSVAEAGGLMFVKDMFFLHELARKINIWQSFVIISPYMGPLLAAFQLTKLEWRWPFWIFSIETGICLALVVLFLDETYYDRRIPREQKPLRRSRLHRLIGSEQWQSRSQRGTFKSAVMRPIRAILKPVIFLTNFFYVFSFAWVVGINTTLAIFLTPLYDFGPKQIGFIYFSPVIAVILGEIVGHWLHDAISQLYIKRHDGRLEPEARLAAIWLAEPFMVSGLILLGYALERKWSYYFTALFWGLYIFGIMITSVSLNAYQLDCYPTASGELGAWLNFSRIAGGFVISYVQVSWAKSQGPQKSFAVQGAVCASVSVIIVVLQIYGKRMRMYSGPFEQKAG